MSNSTLVAPGVAASVGLQDHSGTTPSLRGAESKAIDTEGKSARSSSSTPNEKKKAAQSQLGIPTKREKERHRKRFFQKQKQPLATFGLGFTRLDSETQTKLPCVLAGIRHPLKTQENP